MNEHHSDESDDIYDDLDSCLSPNSACMDNSYLEGTSEVSDFTKTRNNTITKNACASSASNFSLNEDRLKKEEWKLVMDLVATDLDEKNRSEDVQAEYVKLKKETGCLRKSLSEKDEKISQLKAEIVTLKKNICSLYKTAKSEIDQKDAMLLDAHKEIDQLFQMNKMKNTILNKYSEESSQHQLSTSGRPSFPIQNSNQYEGHFNGKEGDGHNNNKKRNYEASKSENETFSRPSTSFNPPEHNSKWNQDNSKCKYKNHEKPKHVLPPYTINEKCNSYNYTDRRNNFDKSSNQRSERNPKKQKQDS